MKICIALLLVLPACCLATALSDAEKQTILDKHNNLRAGVAVGDYDPQPQGANMLVMEWNDELEAKAATWVNQCIGGHDSYEDRAIPNYIYVGQNFAGSSANDVSGLVQAWFDEISMFTHSTTSTGPCAKVKSTDSCGHYTQLVWAKSVAIGCAAAQCGSMRHLVCNYAPAGNFNNEPVYTAGSPCSACDNDYTFCMSGALCATKSQCDRSGSSCTCTLSSSSCQNGGTFNAESCMCECSSEYYGNKCQFECKNDAVFDYTCKTTVASNMDYCGMGYGPYCPMTCGLCKTSLGTAVGSLLTRVIT